MNSSIVQRDALMSLLTSDKHERLSVFRRFTETAELVVDALFLLREEISRYSIPEE